MSLIPASAPSFSRLLLAAFFFLWCHGASAGFIPINATTTITTPGSPSTPLSITSAPAQTPTSNSNITLSAYTSFAVNTSALQWAGTDFAAVSSVVECQSEYVAYSSRLKAFQTSACEAGRCSSSIWGFLSGTTTAFMPTYTGNLTTLCDGWPRATGEASPTKSYSELRTDTFYPSYTEAPPKCTYDARGCGLLQSAGANGLYQTTSTLDCIWGGNCMLPKEAKLQCRLAAGEVRVFYWPVSKDDASLCSTTDSAFSNTPAPTPNAALVTATYEDMTFTSPSIYLSFASLSAWPCVMGVKSNVWVSAPPDAFSSIRWKPLSETRAKPTVTTTTGYVETLKTTFPVNWADLVSPVPKNQYISQRDCLYWRKDNCSTIFDDYKPDLALPTNPAYYTNLDPKFANCTAIGWFGSVLDPPVPLTTANALIPESSQGSVPVTTTNGDPEPVTTPAAPVTETSAPFAPSTAPADPPATATATATGASGENGEASDPQATGGADPPPSSSDPSHDGSDGDPSTADPAGPATDSDPWDNLGSMISNIWGAQPTAADPGSDPADPVQTTSAAAAAGGQADPSTSNGGGDPGHQGQSPGPGPANGASNTLPVVETAAPGGSNTNDNDDPQAPTLVPVIVTIGTALASAAPAANPQDGDAGVNGGGGVMIGTQTLTPGQTTLLASHTVAVAPTGGALVIDGTTAPLYSGGSPAADPIATAGSSIVVAADPSDPSGVLIGDQPLAPGATTTVDGVRVVVPTSGTAAVVVVGGQTYSIHSTAPSSIANIGSGDLTTITLSPPLPTDGTASAPAASAAAVLTLADGGTTLTASVLAPGTVVLGGGMTTLSAGGPAATAWGSVISVAPGGGALVVGSAGGLGGVIAGGLGGTGAGATSLSSSSLTSAVDGSGPGPSSSAISALASATATATTTGGGDDDPLATASATGTQTGTGSGDDDNDDDGAPAAAATSSASSGGASPAFCYGNGPLLFFFTMSAIPLIFSVAL